MALDNFVEGSEAHNEHKVMLTDTVTPELISNAMSLGVLLVSYIILCCLFVLNIYFQCLQVLIMEQSLCLHVVFGAAPWLVNSSVVAHSHWLLTRN